MTARKKHLGFSLVARRNCRAAFVDSGALGRGGGMTVTKAADYLAALLLIAFMLSPLFVAMLRDFGCTHNCRQGRNCTCRNQEKSK